MTDTEALKAIHVEARRFCELDEYDDAISNDQLVYTIQLMGKCSRRWKLVYKTFREAEDRE